MINYAVQLEANRKYVRARQLLKSATSIGANIREKQNADSRADFIHKMKIAAKETEYWILLCKHDENYLAVGNLLDDCITIKKILTKIIATSKTYGQKK